MAGIIENTRKKPDNVQLTFFTGVMNMILGRLVFTAVTTVRTIVMQNYLDKFLGCTSASCKTCTVLAAFRANKKKTTHFITSLFL